MISYGLNSPFLLPFHPATGDDDMKHWLNCLLKQSGWDCVFICYTRLFAQSVFHLCLTAGNCRVGRANQSRSWCIKWSMYKTWVQRHPFVSNTFPRNGCRGTLMAGTAVRCLRTQQLASCPFVVWSWNNIQLSRGQLSPVDNSEGIYLAIVWSHQVSERMFSVFYTGKWRH